MLSFDVNQLALVCMRLGICTLNDDDYTFMGEYMKCMRPIAEGLTYLEGDKCTFGAYAPMLMGIRAELDAMKDENFRHCKPLLKAIRDGFKKRFGAKLDPYDVESVPLYLAMVSNPKFKMSFIPDGALSETRLVKIKQIFLHACEKMKLDSATATPVDNAPVVINSEFSSIFKIC